jgi:hypothetical protein
VAAPQSRCKFDVDAFAAQYGLTKKADIVFKVSVSESVRAVSSFPTQARQNSPRLAGSSDLQPHPPGE